MTDFTDSLRIPEGKEFDRRAKALAIAIERIEILNVARSLPIQQEINSYFAYLLEECPKRREEPGSVAEFGAIVSHYLAIPRPPEVVHPLRSLITDLSALCAMAFLSSNGQAPQFFVDWRTWRLGCFGARFYDARPLFDEGAATLINSPSLDFPTKAMIMELMADVLPEGKFDPNDELRSILSEDGLKPSQLLALQVWQRRHRTLRDAIPGSEVEERLGELFAPVNGSLENTLLYWVADTRPQRQMLTHFCEFLFVRWGWLTPVDYTAPIGASRLAALSSKQQRLSECFASQPEAVAQRKTEPEGREFPFLIDPTKGQTYQFAPISILPIGGSGFGKTSFLCAFADAVVAGAKCFQDQTEVRSDGLLKLLNSFGHYWRGGGTINTSEADLYEFDAGHRELSADCWVRMSLADYQGEFSTIKSWEKGDDAKKLAKDIKTACGLFFFIDERVLALSPEEARELAAWYQKIVRDIFHLPNITRRHIPIAFVINKADKVFNYNANQDSRGDWLEDFGTTRLVPEGTAKGIDLGTGVAGDLDTSYKRFHKAIHYNKAVSRSHKSQRRILEILDRFSLFFTEVLSFTYRYQIFLATSVRPAATTAGQAVSGVTDAMHWMVHQLLPTFRQQAQAQLDTDIEKTQEVTDKLKSSVLEVKELRSHWQECKSKLETRGDAERGTLSKIINKVKGDPRAELEKAGNDLKEKLNGVCAELGIVVLPEEKPPFDNQIGKIEAVIEGLEKQARWLRQWHGDLDRLTEPAQPPGK